jgi:hypothetical protein
MRQRAIFLRSIVARLALALPVACALALTVAALPASATGTLRVQESDGKVNVYPDVVIRLISHKALTITSADGKGVVKIDQAACSYAGELRSCLLYHMEWIQAGQLHPIDLVRGTIYANLTGQGTNVSMTGTIDEVKK